MLLLLTQGTKYDYLKLYCYNNSILFILRFFHPQNQITEIHESIFGNKIISERQYGSLNSHIHPVPWINFFVCLISKIIY